MIRYAKIRGQELTLETLRAAIQMDATDHPDPEVRKAVETWLDKAKERTEQLKKAKAYLDSKKWEKLSTKEQARIGKLIAVEWADVKYIFMEIQHNKCAYCEQERAAGSSKGGSAEHHVEHFRPKNPVKEWPTPKEIDLPMGDAADPGYYWLAFHLLNYCCACTTCNSGYKKNYFPIRRKRGRPHTEPGPKLDATEKPYLIYPLGTADDDPEDVIRFGGVAAFPKDHSNTSRNGRAQVIIAFFDLNGREELFEGRAKKIRELSNALRAVNASGTTTQEVKDAKDDIRRLISGYDEHTNCIRSMLHQYQSNPETARYFFWAASEYLRSKMPPHSWSG